MTFCFVAILVLAIFLRDENSRMFYTLRMGRVEKKQLELREPFGKNRTTSRLTPV